MVSRSHEAPVSFYSLLPWQGTPVSLWQVWGLHVMRALPAARSLLPALLGGGR